MGKSDGFTYIELIVVIIVMGILSASGYAAYSRMQAREYIRAQGQILIGYLDLAREKTSAGDETAACETYGGYYAVELDGSALTLTPEGCPATTTYEFDGGVSFPEGDFVAAFDALGTGYTGPSCIIVQHPTDSHCSKITVTGAGVATDVIETTCSCP